MTDHPALDFEVEINGQHFESRYREIMSPIDISDINTEFVKHPERYGWISFLAREAEIRYEISKRELDFLESRLDDEKRGEYHMKTVEDPKFKVTETVIKNAIRNDDRFVTQSKVTAELGALQKRLQGARETLIERRHALISLAANLREGAAPSRVSENAERATRVKEHMKDRAEAGAFPHLQQHQAPGLPAPDADPLPTESPEAIVNPTRPRRAPRS